MNRVCDADAAPVVVQVDLDGLVLLIDVAGEQILDARVLGERDVRALIEEEALVVAERRRVASIVRVLVVHDRPDAFGVEAVRGTEAGHAGSEHDDACH